MAQAKGSAVQYLLYQEATYGNPPVAISALVMPAKEDTLKGSRNLNESELKTGNRNAAAPQFGNQDVSGSLTVPVDLRAFGWFLAGLIGTPTTTQQAAKSINNGEPAVDRSGGVVGIPVTSHGYQAGESVTIAATSNYNGTYTVLSSSTTHEVRITATYQAETFGADDTIRAARYTHVFKIHASNSLPSYGIEKGFTDIAQYFVFEGIKFGGFSMEVGGDKAELFATIDMLGAIENAGAGTSVDSSPTTISLDVFGNYEASVTEGGSPAANVRKLSIKFDNKNDGDTFVLGGGGVRGSINEGTATPTGSIECMFENSTIYNKAINGTETSIGLTFTKGVYSLAFSVPEVILGRDGIPVSGSGGVWLNSNWQGYYSNNADATSLKVTLVNDVSSYAWS